MQGLTPLRRKFAALKFIALTAALLTSFGTVVILGGAPSHAAEDSALPVIQLRAGLYIIHAEVASRPADLQRGLMFRTQLPQQRGMLFVFPYRQQQCMWMLNTYVPLAVAFLRDDGTIVNIEEMEPLSQSSHCSSEPVRLALEMNAGWFAQRNIKPGDVIRGIPSLPALH